MNGHKSSDLHSDHSQNKRAHILSKFREGRLKVLVATDVAARGLDIPEINLVVQVGFPSQGIEYYIHRSGRCGRAGRIGTSILIDDRQLKIDSDLFRLLKFTKLNVPEEISSKADQSNLSESTTFGRQDFYQKDRNSYNNRDSSSYNNSDRYGGNKSGFNRDYSSMDYKKRDYNRERGGFNKYGNNNESKKYSREEDE